MSSLRTASTTDLGNLRKIWEESCFAQPVTTTLSIAQPGSILQSGSEEILQERFRHGGSVEQLRDITSGMTEWWPTLRTNSTDQRKAAPIGNRQRDDIFGGSYDSGAGYYETSTLFNKRVSRFESAPSIYSATSSSTASYGEEARRSSSASTWEASSGYSSERTSPRKLSGSSPFTEDRFSPPTTRSRQAFVETSSFFEALNSIGQQQHDRYRRDDQRMLEQEYQIRQQKLHQEQELDRKKASQEQDVQRLCKLLSSFILDNGEDSTQATSTGSQTASKLDRILTLKQMLGEELNSLGRSKQMPITGSTSRDHHQLTSRYRGVIGEQLRVKTSHSPLSSSLGEANEMMSLMRNNIGTGVSRPQSIPRPLNPYEAALETIEREAKQRRTSAFQSNAPYTWKGTLAPRSHSSPTYASKVFVGGLPYNVSAEMLTEVFSKFGASVQLPPRGRGHAYLVFDSEVQVQALLRACEMKGPSQFYYWVPSRCGKDRKAQVIPWAIEDSDWISPDAGAFTSAHTPKPLSLTSSSSESDSSASDSSTDSRSPIEDIVNFDSPPSSPRDFTSSSKATAKQNTVFVGALHGEITAEGLQKILSDLFGPILHVGIDMDRCRYPNGSGRVTFASAAAFRRAVLAEYVHVVTPRFSKTIQLDAYIEDGTCTICRHTTPVFCRHPDCFRYYCATCFLAHRADNGDYHPPVMRNRNSAVSAVPMFGGASAGGLNCIDMNPLLKTQQHVPSQSNMMTPLSTSAPSYAF